MAGTRKKVQPFGIGAWAFVLSRVKDVGMTVGWSPGLTVIQPSNHPSIQLSCHPANASSSPLSRHSVSH
uniref:HDC18398 n=1 Tax=Drosophila melanogaster TaxID=7227 RepID=Q6IIF9_DROME|nr:TPA_inf: HDC18398 [Drosophila melanogaster]